MRTPVVRTAMVAVVLLFACSSDDAEESAPSTTTTTAPASTTTTVPAYEPAYEEGDCPDTVPEDARVTCGFLTVPEDRSDPDGAQVRLPVATVAPSSGRAQADPVVYLEGGPGFAGLDLVRFFLDVDLAPGRNVITFDQRGTGGAEPSLQCPEVDAMSVVVSATPNADAAEDQAAEDANRACRDRLVESGVDLGAYDTSASAADLADLRVVMGIEEWNLFGVSYGTTLALETMRSRPDGIRSVVIDSVAPPHAWEPLDPPSFVERFDRVLALLEQRCAEDPECAAAFPDPLDEFDQMVEKYEAEPFRGTITNSMTGEPADIAITGQDIVGGAFQAFYDSGLIPLLPSITRQLLNGDTSVISPLAQQAHDTQVRNAEAMGSAVECADAIGLVEPGQEERIAELIAERPVWKGFIGEGASRCELWDVPPAADGFNEPVTSDIRTLVLAGEFDPVTPPELSRSAADHLGDAAYVELPGLGHGVVFANDCAKEMFQAFLDEPDAPVDQSCVEDMGPPDWVIP